MSKFTPVELGIRVRSCGECLFRDIEDRLVKWEVRLDQAASDMHQAASDMRLCQDNAEIADICDRIEDVSLRIRAAIMECEDEYESND